MRIRRLRRWIKVFGFLIDGTLLLNSGRVLYFFYTDTHDVDEDLRAIIKQSDMWRAGTNGLFMRALDSIGEALGHVASM